ncbi:amino acid ABC transporter substrate-binding protein [Brenneria roseae subsp. americana]|uniref:Amino acid ABC transporter substrate-binding protein n=1 Tax=Brenneria roseae subsp. americana TaxID=1508507 RepID=A0A2U1TQT4_9GAMM|nr:amino acid ABC transporter substrate-binding protein [Brenneria roseae]PWC11732.1 amino acid ABC transporter substrate-binding protein [Brenneria roseae subsp. americana]
MIAIVCLLPWQLAGAVSPPGSESTLTNIAATKTIKLGHRTDELPFSYVVNGNATGYSVDLCLRIVEGIKTYLKLNEIHIVFVPVTTATRFLLIRNGGIDLECAATTNSAERRKMAEFTFPHFVTATRFVAKTNSGINHIGDLAGRSVSAATGTINVGQLIALNHRLRLNISIMLKKTNEEAFAQVANGKASAFVMDDILLAGLIASSPSPADFVISEDALSRSEPYGILIRPGDLAFKRVVNAELRTIFTDGEIDDIYAKWFLAPVPPDGINLNFPMPPHLKSLFADPKEYLD